MWDQQPDIFAFIWSMLPWFGVNPSAESIQIVQNVSCCLQCCALSQAALRTLTIHAMNWNSTLKASTVGFGAGETQLKRAKTVSRTAECLPSALLPECAPCGWRTPATMESGQNRWVGRCCDFIFLALGAGSGLLASSMGCRIRRLALMNLRGEVTGWGGARAGALHQ